MKGTNEEGTERGMDSARERGEGGSERRRRDWARKGESKGWKETSREVSQGGHWPEYSIFTNHPTTGPLALTLWYYK